MGQTELLEMMRQIAKGLQYLHQNGYACTDLKPENIVVSFRDREVGYKRFDNLIFKLIDLDMVRHNQCGHLRNLNATTEKYWPPVFKLI